MVAHVFVLTCFTRIDVKVYDFCVDVFAVLEGTDEWSDILKRSSPDKL
jgi:hypothetical protein